MKNYSKEIVTGFLLVTFIGGSLFWFNVHEPGATLKVVLISVIALLGLFALVKQVIKRRNDLMTNEPAEDEFTENAKLYASSKAFLYSMALWYVIFIFNASFAEREEMLGVGILGSAAIYGICLWYYKSRAGFNEK